MFSDSECLHVTIKDADQCISCTYIKPENIIKIKCDLGFCDECPKCIIPDEELDYVTNASFIHFSVYTYKGRFANHGITPNVPTLYKLCEENDDKNNGITKRPTYVKKKHLKKSLINFFHSCLPIKHNNVP